MTTWRLRVACWIPKATHIHTHTHTHTHTLSLSLSLSAHVIFFAFPLQQWLHERAWMLRYTYISWLVTSLHSLHFVYTIKDKIKIKKNTLSHLYMFLSRRGLPGETLLMKAYPEVVRLRLYLRIGHNLSLFKCLLQEQLNNVKTLILISSATTTLKIKGIKFCEALLSISRSTQLYILENGNLQTTTFKTSKF